MVNFNFWDKFFGDKPKAFKKKAEKQIKDNTLHYMQMNGRGKWITTEEIFENTLEKTDLFNSKEGKMLFATGGIKAKINYATHQLRKEGHPIIAGVKWKGDKAKGYKYADENSEDFIHDWAEKFSAWEERKSNLIQEFENDKILIERIIERLTKKKRLEEVNKLQEILIKYEKKKNEIKEEEDEEQN